MKRARDVNQGLSAVVAVDAFYAWAHPKRRAVEDPRPLPAAAWALDWTAWWSAVDAVTWRAGVCVVYPVEARDQVNAWVGSSSGGSRLLVVAGRQGCGRTSLVKAACSATGHTGCRVISAAAMMELYTTRELVSYLVEVVCVPMLRLTGQAPKRTVVVLQDIDTLPPNKRDAAAWVCHMAQTGRLGVTAPVVVTVRDAYGPEVRRFSVGTMELVQLRDVSPSRAQSQWVPLLRQVWHRVGAPLDRSARAASVALGTAAWDGLVCTAWKVAAQVAGGMWREGDGGSTARGTSDRVFARAILGRATTDSGRQCRQRLDWLDGRRDAGVPDLIARMWPEYCHDINDVAAIASAASAGDVYSRMAWRNANVHAPIQSDLGRGLAAALSVWGLSNVPLDRTRQPCNPEPFGGTGFRRLAGNAKLRRAAVARFRQPDLVCALPPSLSQWWAKARLPELAPGGHARISDALVCVRPWLAASVMDTRFALEVVAQSVGWPQREDDQLGGCMHPVTAFGQAWENAIDALLPWCGVRKSRQPDGDASASHDDDDDGGE